jgi:hypothetical protein
MKKIYLIIFLLLILGAGILNAYIKLNEDGGNIEVEIRVLEQDNNISYEEAFSLVGRAIFGQAYKSGNWLSCEDTDNGINRETYGEVRSLRKNSKEYIFKDECKNDKTVLKFFCDNKNSKPKSTQIKCPDTCFYGVCTDRDFKAEGKANVYLIDPIDTPNLTEVTLSHLDGSGYLRGKYVEIMQDTEKKNDLPTPMVRKTDLDFIYNPVQYSNEITKAGVGYWGFDELTDSGHRFDLASQYYYYNEAAKYFERMGFSWEKPFIVVAYDHNAEIGYLSGYSKEGRARFIMSMPGVPATNGAEYMHDVRGEVHEVTHAIQIAITLKYFGKDLPYGNLDNDKLHDAQGLVESFAKYFECAFTNTPVDRYIFNKDEIKDFSDYKKWVYTKEGGLWDKAEKKVSERRIGFILASVWWHLREKLGAETTDKLIYESIKYTQYEECAAISALKATIEADKAINSGKNIDTIIATFKEHNINDNTCLK